MLRPYALSLYSLLLVSGLAGQQLDGLEGVKVGKIEFSPNEQPVDARDLAQCLAVEVGQPLHSRQVGETIDRLFATGLYADIKVYAETLPDGVGIRVETEPERFVGHVNIRGKVKDPPSRAVLLGETQLNLGERFDAQAVESAKQNIEKELRVNGLFRGKVDVTTLHDPVTHQVTIGFIVDAGKRARYETPEITGDTKLSASKIIGATTWRLPLIHRWRYVSKALTDRGLDGVSKTYAKKDRLTASVELTKIDFDAERNRARAELAIDAGPIVDIRALEAKVSKRKLRKYVPVYQEGSLDNDLLTEGARNLRDYFQSRGYVDADVSFKREPVKNDRAVVNYEIAAGARRKLVSVAITGNKYFKEDTLRERMFLRPNSLLLRYGRYSESFRQKDEEALTSLYQNNGFKTAKVTSSVTAGYKGKENDLLATFQITEGPQWLVSKLEIQGSKELDLNPIRGELTSVEGQPFAEVNIASDRNRILQYYFANGFVAASFRYRMTPDPATSAVSVVYVVREGRREYVRGVLTSGLDVTRPKLIEKAISAIKPGEPVSMQKLSNVSKQLSDLGVFATVNSGLQDASGRNAYKYVLYDFDEANRYTFNTGFGLEVGQFGHTTTSLSQAGGAKGISPIASFDVTRLNFLGRGQTVSLQTKYSTLEQRESLNYIVPRFLGSLNRTVTFSVLYDTTQDVQTFSSRRTEGSVQTSQRFNRASTLLLRFAYRRVSAGNVYIPSLLIPQLLQPVRIGIVSASYIQDHRDNPADAHHGFFNTVDAAVAGKFFGSERSFMRVLARNSTYTPIGRHLTFARQTQIGAIVPFQVAAGTSDANAIPLPERFFGGGGVSMRGFGDNQAGPRDIGTTAGTATGFPIGGNALFFNTFELRFPLLGPNVSGVFFHDMGNIYSSFGNVSLGYKQSSNASFDYALQAPGFGVRYKTPLGPVRVDFSYALNPTNYQGYAGNLTIQQLLACGTGCQSGPQRLSHFNFFFSIGQAF